MLSGRTRQQSTDSSGWCPEEWDGTLFEECGKVKLCKIREELRQAQRLMLSGDVREVWHGRAEVDARGSRDRPQRVVRHEVCVPVQSSDGERHPQGII